MRSLATLAIAGLALLPVLGAAQRFHIRQDRPYVLPGSGMRIYPPPRYGYRIGSTVIYPGRNQSYWPYGAPRGYSWPYGNSWNYGRGNGGGWYYGNGWNPPQRRNRRGR